MITKKDPGNYINIKLENFHFFHRATSSSEEDMKYIHRDEPEHRLKNWLCNPNRHGTYLVSGYRGVGKSSLVGSVIRQLKQEKKREYIDVCVNIGQENVNELNILQITAKNLRNELIDTVSVSRRGFKFYHLMYLCDTHGYHIILMCIVSIVLLFMQQRFGLPGQTILSGDAVVRMTQGGAPSLQGLMLEWITYVLVGFSVLCCLFFVIQKGLRQCVDTFRAIDLLEKLCTRFNSKTTYRHSAKSGFDQFQFGSVAMEREIQAANIQEIEYELTQILSLYKSRKVIIVLDELDKTEASTAKDIEKEIAPDYEKVSIRPEQHTTSRSRRIQVLNVIANMKFFLSTADAYFIFIAGRELYEASMADLSDRDFSISNIFNGIINVDSFFSHPHIHDSIAYTEEFVCRQIIPRQYVASKLQAQTVTLRDYREYRECIEPRCDGKRLDKEIVFLYHFISYLAFISNGSPKKITTFFEKYIRTSEYLRKDGRIEESRLSGDKEFWLSFGYNNQMMINFVHYITYPVLQNIMSRSSALGDKLQVSDSFLLIHIFKLHQGGFSWRNLEHTPEVLEINRSPEIRDYIGTLIKYLNHTSLTTISCGLYQYKFPLRFAEEISYFSKLSDEFSALFNFSLDELQSVKELYFRTIGSSGREAAQPRPDTYTEASIRHSLGDIYMQEENYSAAIRQFEKCIEIAAPMLINNPGSYEQFQNYLLFYNRTMLKLGLAHEKRHTDNSAYAIYNDLIDNLITIKLRNPRICNMFRDNRTMHLGILARLYVIEKLDTTGLQAYHIEEALQAFEILFNRRRGAFAPNPTPNRVVTADFYRKLGDILYYKNSRNLPGEYAPMNLYFRSICILLDIPYESKYDPESIRRVVGRVIRIVCDTDEEYSGEKVERDNHIYNLAILFESLGHIYLQRPNRLHKSDIDRLAKEFESVRSWVVDDFRTAQWPQFGIHCAILCYWAASKLYGASCERDLAGRCYKQLLWVLSHYVRQVSVPVADDDHSVSCSLVESIGRMASFLTRRFVMSQYRQYEHINFAEVTQIGRMLKTDDPSLLAIHLSLYPGIDEMQSLYYSFLRNSHESYGSNKAADRKADRKADSKADSKADRRVADRVSVIEQKLMAFMNKELVREEISNSTLNAIILRHKTAANLYLYFLQTLLGISDWKLDRIPVSAVREFLDGKNRRNIPRWIRGSMAPKIGEAPAKDYGFSLVREILAGGIKNAYYIIQMIGPMNNSTLFNHTFYGYLYMELAFFQIILEQLCHYCGYSPFGSRAETFLLDGEGNATAYPNPNNPHYAQMEEWFSLEYMQRFYRYSNVNYFVENAIHSFTKARQCSSQGHSYQELIRSMHFLDDDLNNDTIQFHLSLERAASAEALNIEQLLKGRFYFNRSPYYLIETYLPGVDSETVSLRITQTVNSGSDSAGRRNYSAAEGQGE